MQSTQSFPILDLYHLVKRKIHLSFFLFVKICFLLFFHFYLYFNFLLQRLIIILLLSFIYRFYHCSTCSQSLALFCHPAFIIHLFLFFSKIFRIQMLFIHYHLFFLKIKLNYLLLMRLIFIIKVFDFEVYL